MGIVACILSLALLILNFIHSYKKKAISPFVIFYALWTFILFLSVLNLYNILKPSDMAYELIILMLVFFELGNFTYFLIKKYKTNKGNKEKNNQQKTMELRTKWFYAICGIIVLFNVIDMVIIIQQLAKGNPIWQIRNWTLEPFGSENPILSRRSFIESVFRTIVLAPCETIIPPIAAYYFFNCNDKKKRIKLLIASLSVLITSSIAGGGGRLGFIYYIGCFLLSFFVLCKNKKGPVQLIKKYKKIMLIFIIIGVILIVAYTTIRTGVGNVVKQTYTYFALPPTLLSIWLPDISNANYTYGMTSLFGFHSYFFRVLDTIGLESFVPPIYDEVYHHILNAEVFKQVGYGVGNAFVTPIYYFMIDGGPIFVGLASFVFGLLIMWNYEKFCKNINARSFAVYGLIMYGIFVTFMRVQTAIPAYIISFIIVFLLIKCKKTNNSQEQLDNQTDDEVIQGDKISVIVPIYNTEKYLEECIESIIHQTYTNLEIILVDDGSIDKSGYICDVYAKKDERIKVIHQKNLGVSVARNVGLNLAKGKWITFVDADDWIEKNFCNTLYKETLKNKKVDIVISGYNRIYYTKKEKINCENKKLTYNNREYLIKLLNVQNGYGFCHMKLFRKEIIDKIRFNEAIQVGEDALFNIELVKNIHQVTLIGQPLYNYRLNNNSVVRKYDKNYPTKYVNSMIQTREYLLKNYSHDIEIEKNYYNYVAYHFLLIAVNYCFNRENNESIKKQIITLKEIYHIELFHEAIKKCNYQDLSKTRSITLFTIKHQCFLLTAVICLYRQYQFSKSNKKEEEMEFAKNKSGK